ncbi:MAG: SDR family NAD(P)-dependent oxidoreductase [bacterium]
MRLLEGKVAIVTGAGRPKGMGRATALKLAVRGARVVVTDVGRKRPELEVEGFLGLGDDLAALESLVDEIRKAGSDGMAMAVDVTEAGQIHACVQRTCERFGGIDILFNNAGTPIATGPFLEIPDESWELSWRVNVKGMKDFCRAVIPKMIERGGGSIINNSSGLGLAAMPGYAGYVTTKFAIVGLTKAIASEFGCQKIRCNAVCPGNILTDMGEAEILFIAAQKGVSLEEARVLFGEPAALGRGGLPEEVAEVVVFLAGPGASFLTGVAIPVAGGLPLGI